MTHKHFALVCIQVAIDFPISYYKIFRNFSASTCSPLARPTHGIISPPNCLSSKLYVGETCKIQCPQGFQSVGSSLSVCQNGPKWSLAHLDCTPIATAAIASRNSVAIKPTSTKKQISQGAIHAQGRIVVEADTNNQIVQPRLNRVQKQNEVFRPHIKCPRDTTIVLPSGQSSAHIKLEQPKTNVNWKT